MNNNNKKVSVKNIETIYNDKSTLQKSVIGPKLIKFHNRLIVPLTDTEEERLNWEIPFKYKGMVRIRIPMDGSCFFHAIAKSYCIQYITGRLDNGTSLNRSSFIKNLRKDLSLKLGTKVNPQDPRSLTYYETLSRKELPKISESIPAYSLANMEKELDSDSSIDNIYNEFISNEINKDIYILDMIKQDVYITGNDNEILYKNRPSIVILYLPGHYELIGLKKNGLTKTVFSSDHKFIQNIRERMAEITNN